MVAWHVCTLLPCYPAPETPQEPMEFLSCSWSISSLDTARALASKTQLTGGGDQQEHRVRTTVIEADEPILQTVPFTFASSITSQLVMERIMTPGAVSFHHPLLLTRRRQSLVQRSLGFRV
jgi:hypothetical protein